METNLKFQLFVLLFLLFSCSTQQSKKEEKQADLYYSYGSSFLIKQEYTQALTNLLKAYELRPNDSKINNNLGMAYYFKGKLNLAEKHLIKSIEINPKASDAKNNLASIYFRKKKFAQARKYYNEVLNDLTFEEQFRTLYNLALVDIEEEKYRDAIKTLNRSVEQKSDYCPSFLKLGEISYRFQKYQEALAFFNKSHLGSCYNSPIPQYHQAKTLIKLKRIELAKDKLRDLIKRFPGSSYSKFASKQLSILQSNKQNL